MGLPVGTVAVHGLKMHAGDYYLSFEHGGAVRVLRTWADNLSYLTQPPATSRFVQVPADIRRELLKYLR